MSANPHRGEVSLKLGERELTLRPTFAALVAIERETGMGILQIAERIGHGSIELLPVILREAAKAAGEEIDDTTIGELIFETGVLTVLKSARQLVANAVTGGADPKNLEAAGPTAT